MAVEDAEATRPALHAGGRSEALQHFPDLRSSVHAEWQTSLVQTGLQLIFQGSFAPPERIDAYLAAETVAMCRLTAPELEVAFCVRGRTAQVMSPLRQAGRDGPAESIVLDRVCETILRAFPRVRRVLVEVQGEFAPRKPFREMTRGADHVIALPTSGEEYVASLGAATRRNLRKYEHRLEGSCGQVRFELLPSGTVSEGLAVQVLEWNSERMRAKGGVSAFEEHPRLGEAVVRFVSEYGIGSRVLCGERCVAGAVGHVVGRESWLQSSAFEAGFEWVHLGLLNLHWTLRALCGVVDVVHLGAGNAIYKERLGASAVPAAGLVVYRDRIAELLSLRDTAFVAKRRIYQTRPGRLFFLALRRARRPFGRTSRRPRG